MCVLGGGRGYITTQKMCVGGGGSMISFFFHFHFFIYTGEYNLAHGQFSLLTSYIIIEVSHIMIITNMEFKIIGNYCQCHVFRY